jgi:hypothetical protein
MHEAPRSDRFEIKYNAESRRRKCEGAPEIDFGRYVMTTVSRDAERIASESLLTDIAPDRNPDNNIVGPDDGVDSMSKISDS